MSEDNGACAPGKPLRRGNRFMTIAEIMSIPSGLTEEEWSRHAKAIRESRALEQATA